MTPLKVFGCVLRLEQIATGSSRSPQLKLETGNGAPPPPKPRPFGLRLRLLRARRLLNGVNSLG